MRIATLTLLATLTAVPLRGQTPPTIFDAALGETNALAPEISTAEIRVIVAEHSALVLDVRPHMEWATSHIPGALLQQTLDGESAANEKLTAIADSKVNAEASSESGTSR